MENGIHIQGYSMDGTLVVSNDNSKTIIFADDGVQYRIYFEKDKGLHIHAVGHPDTLLVHPKGSNAILLNVDKRRQVEKQHSLEKADMQITGFDHASKGYSFTDLLTSMGCKKKEWATLKDTCNLTPEMIKEGDEYFAK